MHLFLQLAGLEFVSALLIVGATRAQASGSYKWTAVTEFLWLCQWFLMQKLMIEQRVVRTTLGFWAFQLGAIGGAMTALWISKRFSKDEE